MRTLRIVPLLMLIGAACWAETALGIWKMSPARSTDPYPTSFTVRFEPHAKGEVFTVDRIGRDGRATSSSTILYLDGKARDFQDDGCSGTQSSRRVDNRTVEILRKCASGEWTRFVRRLSAQPKELILEITEQQSDGHRFERRLVLEKQSGVLSADVFCKLALGQATPPAILEIDIENFVEYQGDISDLTKIATNPNVTPASRPRNFFPATILGDIVAVNGQPAKGTIVGFVQANIANPGPGSRSGNR